MVSKYFEYLNILISIIIFWNNTVGIIYNLIIDKLPHRKRTGYQSENYDRPKGRGIKPSSAAGGLK